MPTLTRRFLDAPYTQSACNPIGLANTLLRWQREILDAGGDTNTLRADPACRLLVYQLAFLLDVEHMDGAQYEALLKECEARAVSEGLKGAMT